MNQETKKKKEGGCLKFVVIVIMLWGVVSLIGNHNSYSGSDNESDNKNVNEDTRYTGNYSDKILAYNYAKDFVKKKLKSPSSAVFPDSQHKVDNTEYVGNATYEINSYVDSQNSFGAMIRTNFSCTIYFENGSVFCKDLILH